MLLSILFISCDKEDDEVTPPETPAVAEWAGVYNTETQWWGGYYSPLIITADGKMFIDQFEIDYEFDQGENRLTFDWQDIKEYRAKGNIVFSVNDADEMVFSGSINPRAQDGPVGYSGREL